MTKDKALDTMGATLDDWVDKKNMEHLINKIYDDFEASNALLVRASEHNSEVCAYEIERLRKKHKEELKKAYFEGRADCSDNVGKDITAWIALLEDDL